MSDPHEPLVIGLDSSTQSTKAIAWSVTGQEIAEGRAEVPMQNPGLDRFEQNPGDWWLSACEALKSLTSKIDTSCLQGIAISNQRETLGLLDENDSPSYPAIVWLDERCREEVHLFSEAFGASEIHRITGRHPDTTPCLYSFSWLKKHEPEAWAKTRYFVDVQSYLVKHLCGGHYRTGWISADPMGLFDMQSYTWSASLLEALELDSSRLPEVHPPGTPLGIITAEAASATGLPAGLPVFAAGGDGQCAGLGVDCTVQGRAYINLGTAIVSGIWSPEYRYDAAWRTELAAQGEGYIYETCLRSGAFLINWFVDRFVATGKADAALFERLEASALELPIGSDGLLVQPYFAGAMDPHWDVSALGIMMGLSGSHTEAHIYRAIIESITIDQVMRSEAQEIASGQHIDCFVAIGGGAQSPLWRQMLADASGKPVHVSDTIEASALGAGMIAAAGAGWYDSIVEAAGAMAGKTTAVHPDPERRKAYSELLEIYKPLYHATRDINHQLVAFAARQRR